MLSLYKANRLSFQVKGPMLMRKFYSLVVRNPKKLLALFALLVIAAACARRTWR